jgi:hypothetical protein
VALLLEKLGRDGGVHPAAQADDDSLFDHDLILSVRHQRLGDSRFIEASHA